MARRRQAEREYWAKRRKNRLKRVSHMALEGQAKLGDSSFLQSVSVSASVIPPPLSNGCGKTVAIESVCCAEGR